MSKCASIQHVVKVVQTALCAGINFYAVQFFVAKDWTSLQLTKRIQRYARVHAHFVANVKLPSQRLRFRGVQSFAHDVLADCRNFYRSHADRTMMGVFVRVYEICQNVERLVRFAVK